VILFTTIRLFFLGMNRQLARSTDDDLARLIKPDFGHLAARGIQVGGAATDSASG
jgi:hypothetical protein